VSVNPVLSVNKTRFSVSSMIYQAVITDSLVGSLTKLDPSAVYSDMYLFSIVHQVGMNLSKETHKGEIIMSKLTY
jgi:hypothetical protein